MPDVQRVVFRRLTIRGASFGVYPFRGKASDVVDARFERWSDPARHAAQRGASR